MANCSAVHEMTHMNEKDRKEKEKNWRKSTSDRELNHIESISSLVAVAVAAAARDITSQTRAKTVLETLARKVT